MQYEFMYHEGRDDKFTHLTVLLHVFQRQAFRHNIDVSVASFVVGLFRLRVWVFQCSCLIRRGPLLMCSPTVGPGPQILLHLAGFICEHRAACCFRIGCIVKTMSLTSVWIKSCCRSCTNYLLCLVNRRVHSRRLVLRFLGCA